MFYCNNCAEQQGYPKTTFTSAGPCEICGNRRGCNDVPSSKLPEPRKLEYREFRNLEEKQHFMFLGDVHERYVCQKGRLEMYCPAVGQNTMGHSKAGGEEVYLKNDRTVIFVETKK